MKRLASILVIFAPSALVVLGFGLWEIYQSNESLRQAIADLDVRHESILSERLRERIQLPLTVSAGELSVAIPAETLSTWTETHYRWFTRREELRLNPSSVRTSLAELVPRLHTRPSNATFAVEDDLLYEVVPSREGSGLDLDASVAVILRAMSRGEPSAELVVVPVEPDFSMARLAELEITGRLAAGTSSFAGSPKSRTANIHLGAKKFNHILIAPGASLSFNAILGEVDANSGFLPELVIKGAKIVPEYGGGICQVSTTLFRAAFAAGLQILERQAHSLPVRYYNPQGYDATIYPGVVDLRFLNDTDAPILIQSSITGTTLTFELFGAPDGRVTTVRGPTVYESDPDGSLKAVISRTVTNSDGSEKKISFYSSYKSPAMFQTIRNPLE